MPICSWVSRQPRTSLAIKYRFLSPSVFRKDHFIQHGKSSLMTLIHIASYPRTEESQPHPCAWLLAGSNALLAAIISHTSWVVFFRALVWSPSWLLHLSGMFVAELVQETLFPQGLNFHRGHQCNCTTLNKGLELSKAEAEENRTGKKKGWLMMD